MQPDLPALRLAHALGIHRSLLPREVCHSYQHGCKCRACKHLAIEMRRGFTESGQVRPKRERRQPWEVAA